jgi:hypothetical protein
MRLLLLLFGCLLFNLLEAQPRTDPFLKDLLERSDNPVLREILRHHSVYRPQILYTRIDRDSNNRPVFTNYYYNVDPLLYFNPASTVKLPLALLSLEKLNDLHIAGVGKFTSLQLDSGANTLRAEYRDSTAQSGLPSLAHFIRKAFLVSDNDAYNRMYEFLGQQTINRRLHELGYTDARITRHFYRMTEDQNRHTNQVRFVGKNGDPLFVQPPADNPDPFDFSHINKIGIGFYNSDDSLVHEPMDFTRHNNISLADYQGILRSALFPLSVPERQRFRLTKEDYQFLYQYLSQFPSETNYPKYDSAAYYDSYVKFFFSDSTHHHLPDGIRVFNKVGWAYGFLTDISYVVDFKHHVEYMLAATVYANSDGILNDDKYDFETVAHPFMYAVGQAVYQYELQRPRKYTPDLSAFHIDYERRADDNRNTIREVDN